MKHLLVILFFVIPVGKSYAGLAPIEIKEFLQDTIPANCAYAFIGECDHADCWGQPEVFFFGLRDTLQNPLAHSFKSYTVDSKNFETQFEITNDGVFETLKMSLFKQAWAPALPDHTGRDVGVAKFKYTITKKMSSGKIVFAQEAEYVKRRTFFGPLDKKWKQNADIKTCQD